MTLPAFAIFHFKYGLHRMALVRISMGSLRVFMRPDL